MKFLILILSCAACISCGEPPISGDGVGLKVGYICEMLGEEVVVSSFAIGTSKVRNNYVYVVSNSHNDKIVPASVLRNCKQ